MRIANFLRDLFGTKNSIVVSEKIEAQKYRLAVEDFAIQMAINLIAGAISKCEFKTVIGGEFKRKNDYYLFNVEPNANQNSSQFYHELVSKLLYYNECLVVEQNGQLIIADNFTRTPYALFRDVFSNVSRGSFSFNKSFYSDQVLYFTYSNANIRALLSELMQGYGELLTLAVGKYKRAGGRKGVVNADSTPQQSEKWQAALDDLYGRRFKSFYQNENALVVLPKGIDYKEISGEGSKKSTSEVSDIASITKEAFSRAAQAVRIPPALLMGEIADVDSLMDEWLTICIDPICDLIQTEINRKYYGKEAYLKGSYIKADTTCIKHIDVFGMAEKADKLISSGIYSIDELREKIGELHLGTWWSKTHWITKNYESVQRLTEGGEINEDRKIGDNQ